MTTQDDTLKIIRDLLRDKGDEDAALTIEEIKKLHDGVETRIDALMEKTKKRLAEKKKNKT